MRNVTRPIIPAIHANISRVAIVMARMKRDFVRLTMLIGDLQWRMAI